MYNRYDRFRGRFPQFPAWRRRGGRFAARPRDARPTAAADRSGLAQPRRTRIQPKDPDSVQWPPEVVADGPIALARLIPAGVDVRGEPTRARIVLFRKPIERRAKDSVDLTDLLHEILVAQVATYLGVEPTVIDPSLEEEE